MGGKWLIHRTKHRNEDQLQSLELPVECPRWEYKLHIKKSNGNMFNPIF